MKEISYIEGAIYKESKEVDTVMEGFTVGQKTVSNAGVSSLYYAPSLIKAGDEIEQDKLIPLISVKTDSEGKELHKKYQSTSDYRELLGMDGGVDINSFGVSLCPSVDIWGGVGQIEEEPNGIELYFNVLSEANIQDISNYYNLPNPLPVDNDLDSNRPNWTIREYKELGIDLVLGSVVFDNKTPIRLKIYKLEKD
jgi:hypothetical protein